MLIEKKIVAKYSFLGSSQNSEELSLTVKGILVALIPVAMYIARYYNVDLNYNTAYAITEAITSLVASFTILYGILRKLK